jgi:hypothetical protein
MRDVLTAWEKEGLCLREGYGVRLPNVHLGVSVEDQPSADVRIPILLQTPAAITWVSMEPLLGPVNIDFWLDSLPAVVDQRPRLDWVVVGGESGPKARPMHPAWPRSLRDQCAAAGVPFLFKQWGEWRPMQLEECESGNARLVSVDSRRTSAGYQMKHQLESMLTEPHYAWQCPVVKVGKKSAGRLLDGVEHNGYPK